MERGGEGWEARIRLEITSCYALVALVEKSRDGQRTREKATLDQKKQS